MRPDTCIQALSSGEREPNSQSGDFSLSPAIECGGTRKSGRLIPELDGVRGIAILLVLLFHFEGPRPTSALGVLFAPSALGWSGVDLFFVLSGFLITGILMDTRRSFNYLSSFYVRRILRIFPLYLTFIFAYFMIALPVARHFGHGMPSDSSLQIWYWFHLSNWRSAFGQDVGLLSHLWSLSIEEQFYLIWPMVVLLARPSWLVYICSIMIAVPPLLRFAFLNTAFGWELLHRLTPFRIDTLAVGCLIAVVVRDENWLRVFRTRFRLIALISISLLIAVLTFSGRPINSSRLTATLGYTAFALTYGCLVFSAYVSTGSSKWLPALLRSAPLRTCGKYSYGMYVLHWPLAPYQRDLLPKLFLGFLSEKCN